MLAFFHTVLYFSFFILFQAFIEVGGLEKIYVLYPDAVPSPLVNGSSCGHPTDEAFHLLRDAVKGDIPWPGNVFGISILSCWYFCSDQVSIYANEINNIFNYFNIQIIFLHLYVHHVYQCLHYEYFLRKLFHYMDPIKYTGGEHMCSRRVRSSDLLLDDHCVNHSKSGKSLVEERNYACICKRETTWG